MPFPFAAPLALAAGSFLASKFGGNTKEKMKQVPNMAPYQKNFLQNYYNNPLDSNPLYQQGSNFLQNLYGGQGNEAFEAPYMQNFQQNIVPQLANQFAGQGTGAGALNSSAFQNSLAQAGKNLQVDLAGLRSQRELQGLPFLLQQAQAPGQYGLQGLNYSPFAYHQTPPSQGFFGGALSGLAGGIGQGYGLNAGEGLWKYLNGGNQGGGNPGPGAQASPGLQVGAGGWGF
jgi:hypothetical protein